MKKRLMVLAVLFSGSFLAGCTYYGTECDGCNYANTPTRYVTTTTQVTTRNCCSPCSTTKCYTTRCTPVKTCASCNTCGYGVNGVNYDYGYGPGYGYGYSYDTWY